MLHIEDFWKLKCPLRRHFFQKNVARIGFLKIGPKIAVDELCVHTLVQMVIQEVIDNSALKFEKIMTFPYRHLVYSLARGRWEFLGWPVCLPRGNLKSSYIIGKGRTYKYLFLIELHSISKPIQKCRQNWVFTNQTENRCRRAGRAYFRTNGYPQRNCWFCVEIRKNIDISVSTSCLQPRGR